MIARVRAEVAGFDPAFYVLLAVHVCALLALVPQFFSWSAVAVAAVLFCVTELGITVGYHRLLAHRGFTIAKPLEYALTVAGVLALQHGPIQWVATHRAHHAHPDADGDPHDRRRGGRWAHAEWIFRANPARIPKDGWARWTPDLAADPVHRALDRSHALFTLALAAGLFWAGGWSWVVWGVFVRLAATYQCTWLVNSAAHGSGYRRFATPDRSTNNPWVALVTFGEGWHNNHHAFPASVRHGLAWYEPDPSYWLIRAFAALGLARDLREPARAALDRRALPDRRLCADRPRDILRRLSHSARLRLGRPWRGKDGPPSATGQLERYPWPPSSR